MFRRRPLRRRPPRRPPPGSPRPATLQMLRRANRLMEAGQYAQAYPLLKRLADGAVKHGMPVRAANLYLRAARARLEMGSAADAVDIVRRAIQLLIAAGQTERLRGLLPGILWELERHGYPNEAVALRAEMSALLGGTGTPAPEHRRGTLPTQCPSCSGPVRAGEVTWIDDQSAECAYCGSTIRAA